MSIEQIDYEEIDKQALEFNRQMNLARQPANALQIEQLHKRMDKLFEAINQPSREHLIDMFSRYIDTVCGSEGVHFLEIGDWSDEEWEFIVNVLAKDYTFRPEKMKRLDHDPRRTEKS
jgi:hypothetical protein